MLNHEENPRNTEKNDASADTDSPIAPTTVEVKGWRNGLLLILPAIGGWEAVLGQVDARLDEARARSFWRGAQTTLVCGDRAVSQDELSALVDRCKRAWGLVPVAVVSRVMETRTSAEKLVLVAYDALPQVQKAERREGTAERRETAAPPPVEVHENNALYVSHTIRSGQRVVHDGNLVVYGDVNAGAEVAAGGDILIFGTLRGVAHAGYYGDETARIVAVSLRPPQLRIAGKIARSDEENSKTGAASARNGEVARIEDGAIGVFPL